MRKRREKGGDAAFPRISIKKEEGEAIFLLSSRGGGTTAISVSDSR